MSSEPPKPGAVPGWGQEPAPGAPQPAPGPAAPAPGPGGAIPGWGRQPAPGPAAPAHGPGGAIPGWGQAPVPAAPPPQAPPPEAPQPAPTPPSAPSPAPASPPPVSPPPAAPQPGWGGTPGPAAGGPVGQPPGTWNPQPASASGSNGCLKLILILLAVGAIGFVLLIIGLIFLGNQIASNIGVNGDGTVGKTCTIIDSGALHDTLGGQAEAIELSGFYDATIGIILDKRVLPDAEDCWITADESTPVGRIAKYTGGDAASVFQVERQKAAPTSQDQGNGVSIENSGYYGGAVTGLGDEAFCTGLSPAIQAGVLVRKGDTLVYVSLSGPADGAPPALDTTPDGVVIAPEICSTAQAVARRMLP